MRFLEVVKLRYNNEMCIQNLQGWCCPWKSPRGRSRQLPVWENGNSWIEKICKIMISHIILHKEVEQLIEMPYGVEHFGTRNRFVVIGDVWKKGITIFPVTVSLKPELGFQIELEASLSPPCHSLGTAPRRPTGNERDQRNFEMRRRRQQGPLAARPGTPSWASE